MPTITGLFDSRAAAERAVEKLVQEYDLDRGRIAVHAAGEANADAGTHDRRSEAHHGFASEGADRVVPAEDRRAGLRADGSAGILVSAVVPADMAARAAATFRNEGAAEVATRDAAPGDDRRLDDGRMDDRRMDESSTNDRRAGASHGTVPRGALPDEAPSNALPGGQLGASRAAAAPPGATHSGIPTPGPGGRAMMGSSGTDDDPLKPENAGVASATPVRPAGPAGFAATGLPERLQHPPPDRARDTSRATGVGADSDAPRAPDTDTDKER